MRKIYLQKCPISLPHLSALGKPASSVCKNMCSLAPPNRADHGELTPSASTTASRFSCDETTHQGHADLLPAAVCHCYALADLPARVCRRGAPPLSRPSPPMEKPMRWNLGNIQHVVSITVWSHEPRVSYLRDEVLAEGDGGGHCPPWYTGQCHHGDARFSSYVLAHL
jgi:hypothetical protein